MEKDVRMALCLTCGVGSVRLNDEVVDRRNSGCYDGNITIPMYTRTEAIQYLIENTIVQNTELVILTLVHQHLLTCMGKWDLTSHLRA